MTSLSTTSLVSVDNGSHSSCHQRWPVTVLGEEASWFEVTREDESICIQPREPLPRRCTLRPAALFHQQGYPDVNTVMGRLVFPARSTSPQTYRPFTHDAQRQLRELFLPFFSSPQDDHIVCPTRWLVWQRVAQRLCDAAKISWNGLTTEEISQLAKFMPWPEPLEGCLLHALLQSVHRTGEIVVEIGSFRGRSASMLALALQNVGSDAPIFSIDPHTDQPFNAQQVRLALSQLGQPRRLVQMPYPSDRACRLLKPKSASLIFIDGDHSFDQVLSDFRNYKEILAPGGCLIFHDHGYGNHNNLPEANPDVRKVVEQHVMTDHSLQPLLLAQTQLAFIKRSR